MVTRTSAQSLMKQSFDRIVPDLTKKTMIKFHQDYSKTLFLGMLPKKSKVLVTNLIKSLFSIDEPLHLVLVMHLYSEVMLDAIIRKKMTNSKEILEYSYFQKIQVLHALGTIDSTLENDLKTLNRLRNNFVHELHYDIAEFDLTKFSDMKGIYKKKNYKRKSEKKMLNLLLLKFEIMLILANMTDQFRDILLIDG